jgi:hypothetical protein
MSEEKKHGGAARAFTIRARSGDPLPAGEPDDNFERYEVRVLLWAVEGLSEEDARRVVATYRPGERLPRSPTDLRTRILAVFPDAEVR